MQPGRADGRPESARWRGHWLGRDVANGPIRPRPTVVEVLGQLAIAVGARSRSCSPPSRTPRVVTPRLLKISFAKPRSTSGLCRRSSRSLTGRPGQ
jgi:hypothetical protein